MFRIIPKAETGERDPGKIENYNLFKCISSMFKNLKRGNQNEGRSRRERSSSSHNNKHHARGVERPGQQFQELIQAPTLMTKRVRHWCGYEIRETIGRGMSGKVKCAYSPRTGEYVAIKIVRIGDSKDSRKMTNTEIKVLQSIAHPNLLKLISVHKETYVRKSGRLSEVIHLVLEYAKGGSIYDLMVEKGPLPETITRTYFHQLATALDFCHSRGVYHRDIKPDNLLLTEDFQLKVCDFGLSCIKDDRTELLKTECGTRAYMAPEIFQGLPYNGAKSDCWSAGVVLFIMLSGNSPFYIAQRRDWWFHQLEQGNDEVFWKNHRQHFTGFTKMSQAILTRIFKPDPSQRPTMSVLLNDEWLWKPKLEAWELREAVLKLKAEAIADRFGKTIKRKKQNAPNHDIFRFYRPKGSAPHQQALKFR